MIATSKYFIARWTFLRCVALIYLIAFVSLWVQINGLVGSGGIVPAKVFLNAVSRQMGPERYWLLPTIFWFNATDGFLNLVCGVGTAFSLLAVLGLLQGPLFFCLWIFYLSLTIICWDFLGFQWDNLLLEIGFLSIFFSPWKLFTKTSFKSQPSDVVLWLFRVLLFKLMFSSGIVKLSSHDSAWWNLTALTFHYETQPLPTWIGWYVHQLPAWFQKISAVVMFGIELFVPFLIFSPKRFLRLFACWALIGFQILILLTGNYCFFNLLAIALCVLLIDDESWPAWIKKRFQMPSESTLVHSNNWSKVIVTPITIMFILISTMQIGGVFRSHIPWPRSLVNFHRLLSPFRTVNSYGLFAVMTTKRSEIVVEGSNDGQTWLAYEFKWKPGDLKRRPAFVAPHQPRLDWQMWFAALGTYEDNPWFVSFLERLLEGSPKVLALLANNPFPNAPPHYIRAVMYDYKFTDLKMKKQEGIWWERSRKKLYFPAISLKPKAFN